jgi:ABC-type branched-subunit amino acid transport system ATPase component/ABC-type branched-subunit amino acid transport system permease subunit
MVVLTHGLAVPLPFGLGEASWDLPWGWAALISTLVGVVAAFLIGLPALRVRGMFLAVVTFAFAVAAANWLFGKGVFTGSEFKTSTPFMQAPKVFGIDFTDHRSFYYLCVISLGVMTAIMARIRHTGIGRSMIAVSNNENTAAASTVSPRHLKLVAFALAGGMAAFAGCLFITLRVFISPAETFTADGSLRIVSTAIVGGLGSVAGPILGALYVRGMPALFGDLKQVQLLTSGIGLLFVLMYFPGGLMEIVYRAREAVIAWADRRVTSTAPTPVPSPARLPARATRELVLPEGRTWLRLDDVSVHFGGIRAVNGVSMEVREGELVGLIGTNGAGKSTLMNAIGGFVASTGTIEVLGRDVTGQPAFRRHRAGIGRCFQAARLYPDLTVRETIMVALEARERSSVVASMTGLPWSRASERRKRGDATDLVDLLGLGRYADHFVADLSTGTRRIVELGCLLAVDAKVLMLDEPTAGVAQRETEAFGPLIVQIRRELGAAMVVIEHDMPLIMSISDRVYCLETGTIIAEGSPQQVRSDPAVIASYLGTDERAIERSGVVAVLDDTDPQAVLGPVLAGPPPETAGR